jgi:hypothetical protein
MYTDRPMGEGFRHDPRDHPQQTVQGASGIFQGRPFNVATRQALSPSVNNFLDTRLTPPSPPDWQHAAVMSGQVPRRPHELDPDGTGLPYARPTPFSAPARYNAVYSPDHPHPHNPAAVSATAFLGVPLPLDSLGVAAAERAITIATGLTRQTINDDTIWFSWVQDVRNRSVDHCSVRIEDVQAAIYNHFSMNTQFQAFTGREEPDQVQVRLATYFGQNGDVDRVLFECPGGPTTFAMAALNRDAAGIWWTVGIDMQELESLRNGGVLSPDGSVPDAACFLAWHHLPSGEVPSGDDPEQMRLALLTLTPDQRIPLQESLSQHLATADPPRLTSARPLGEGGLGPRTDTMFMPHLIEEELAQELAGRATAHGGAALAGAQATIRQPVDQRWPQQANESPRLQQRVSPTLSSAFESPPASTGRHARAAVAPDSKGLAFLQELTGGAMPHVQCAPAGAAVTIQQTAYERAYGRRGRDCCPMTALSNHLGVVVPPSVMPAGPGGGNQIDDLVKAVREFYTIEVVCSNYRVSEPASAAFRAELEKLLTDPAIDRITYQTFAHFATLTRDADGQWMLHDRDDLLAAYEQQHGGALWETRGGPLLVLGCAGNMQNFLLDRFNEAVQSGPWLAWFASSLGSRAGVELRQVEYLMYAASEWRSSRPAPFVLQGLSNQDRDRDQFLALQAAYFENRRQTADAELENSLRKNEIVMSQTVEAFGTSFPCTIQETSFNTPRDLAWHRRRDEFLVDPRAAWDQHVVEFLKKLALTKPKYQMLRKTVLNKYRYFLLTGEFPARPPSDMGHR